MANNNYNQESVNTNDLENTISQSFNDVNQVIIEPNPSNGHFDVNYLLKGTRPAQFVLYNIYGQLLLKRDMVENIGKLQIDMKNVASGIYFGSIIHEGKLLKTEKITITN
jgi:hypothetical protein